MAYEYFQRLFQLFPLQPIDLENLLSRFRFLSTLDLGDDAGAEMAFHERVLYDGQSLLHGRSLRDDIDAVRILHEHLLQATHLALDDLQPTDELLFFWRHSTINRIFTSLS